VPALVHRIDVAQSPIHLEVQTLSMIADASDPARGGAHLFAGVRARLEHDGRS
jgi:hypothetical protein